MTKEKTYSRVLKKLTIDCEKCCGLCCVALYFSKSDGFPTDKAAGKPCVNLMSDFSCSIHSKLIECKMKGCLAYDCFGAGQMVTQSIYHGSDWKSMPEISEQMYKVFLIVWQLHQMLWYLVEASSLVSDSDIKSDIDALINENENITKLSPDEILNFDIDKYKSKINNILRNVTKLVSNANNTKSINKKTVDFIGKNLKKQNLDGRDLSMTLLIAANLEGCSLYGTNFLGADLRDANINNTDLSKSIFLTQGQINSAIGNKNTILPSYLSLPISWN